MPKYAESKNTPDRSGKPLSEAKSLERIAGIGAKETEKKNENENFVKDIREAFARRAFV